MEDHWKLVLLIVALVVFGLPLASQLASKDAAQKPAVETKADKAGAKGAKSAPAGPAVPDKPPLLNSSNLGNTKWTMPFQGIPVTVSFFPGGSAVAEAPGFGQLQGTWSVSGATLTVSAMFAGKSQTQTVKISGDQIVVNGQAAKRLQ